MQSARVADSTTKPTTGPIARFPRARWFAPIAVVAVAGVTRFWNLANPHVLIFDEHFYVKDAYSLTKLGYEGRWAKLSDPDFVTGHFGGLTKAAELVQHPPLGKWIISLGLDVFGAANSVGWRVSMAVIGVLAVILLMGVAWLLFRNFALMSIAGGLLAIDGNAIVMSRVGMLDNAVMFFALAAFGAILLDRERRAARSARALQGVDGGPRRAGAPAWWRPWLVVAGLALGLDAGVKWSGFFFLAAFLAYVVATDVFSDIHSDALARRRAGTRGWRAGTLVRRGIVDAVLMVPIAIAAYVATWTGWFATAGGPFRTWANQPGNALSGALAWVPKTVQSFWHFQQYLYEFGVSFDTTKSYAAPASGWLLLARPTRFFIGFPTNGQGGCTPASHCVAVVTDLPNPLIWWTSALCVLLLVCCFVIRLIVRLIIRLVVRFTARRDGRRDIRRSSPRDWRVAAILIGVVGGYVPWLLVPRQTVFQYYTIAFEPYLILALVYAIWWLTGAPARAPAGTPALGFAGQLVLSPRRRRIGWTTTIVFLSLCVVVSVFFLPVWIALPQPVWLENLHIWFPGWN